MSHDSVTVIAERLERLVLTLSCALPIQFDQLSLANYQRRHAFLVRPGHECVAHEA